MKITPTNACRLISERISENFRKSQNKKPTIVKDKIGFKLNLVILQFEWSREWKYSLNGKNNTLCGDAGSKPALHSFYPHLSVPVHHIRTDLKGSMHNSFPPFRYLRSRSFFYLFS